jgi:hypothetical protein
MAKPVGAAGPSNAAAHARQSAPQKRCDPGVGAGICAPSGATAPPPSAHSNKPMDPKIAQQHAQRLIDDAIKASGGSQLLLFSEIDKIFKQERWAVREAIRKDSRFKSIVDEAARILIDACLQGNKPDDSGKNSGDWIMPYFHQRAMDSHPELAAAYVISAVRIFEEKGVVFSPPDRQLRALASHIRKSGGREEQTFREAIRAIDRVGRMVVKPNT